MTEPVTTQKSLIVPLTGDLSGAWGTSALNPNFQTIDALFGGLTTISLAGATTLALSVPATTGIWPGGSVSQSVNSLIRFTGAQTGSATIQFTLPGFYIIENNCTGTTSIRLQPSNLTGNCIGAIPGKKCHVFFDGTHMDYLNMPDPGTAYDLHTNTAPYTLPPWMGACTVAPYLFKDGGTYSVATYPALAQLLGSTYGGNGVTTFGTPDEWGRNRLPYDNTAGRVTSGGSGISGTTFGSAGGSQSVQAHTHVNTLTDPGHTHVTNANTGQIGVQNGGGFGGAPNAATINSATTGITISNGAFGSGGSQNMQPSIVCFLPLIKT